MEELPFVDGTPCELPRVDCDWPELLLDDDDECAGLIGIAETDEEDVVTRLEHTGLVVVVVMLAVGRLPLPLLLLL